MAEETEKIPFPSAQRLTFSVLVGIMYAENHEGESSPYEKKGKLP
jgi:hypothetical protein